MRWMGGAAREGIESPKGKKTPGGERARAGGLGGGGREGTYMKYSPCLFRPVT